MEPPACGSRIRYAGSNGTIKYVGPVGNASGTWLGVEWDDPERGKHDGAKDGKRYFFCRHPRAGSFIRPSSNIKCGISFLQGLSEKYIEQLHGDGSQETVILGSSQGSIQVEVVGLDKVRTKLSRLERLKVVSLDGTLVADADPPGRITEMCPNIRGLDLSLTLISSWKCVANIASELPLLKQLSLNRVSLLPLEKDGAYSSAFVNLTDIQLNGTLLTWQQVDSIITLMPALEALELGYNRLTSLSAGGSHPRLHILNLDNNELTDWKHAMSSISIMPRLETVILSANKFIFIPQPTANEPLPNIKHISLSSNFVNSWTDLEALSQWCPSLQNLSAQNIPLLLSQSQSRSLTIARFPNLERLDGTTVSERERRDAEVLYLTHLAREGVVQPEASSMPFRWEELCQKHGPPQKESKPKEEKLSAHLINLIVGLVKEPPSGRTVDILSQEPLNVLPTMVLRNLRNKIKKSRGQSRGTVMLWVKMRDDAWAELAKEDDTNTLDWIGLEDGCYIIYYIQ